ncbi:tetratricopeptide repeat protein [Neolewinella litorea]|uniref:Tetratricopeptide repeat protein n=1 Tax=Neolewinella litorea TaxID=2562452 RepID=A0A4V3XL75_9BACT|nr:tetratricopeptide repeat protein [Neolewinella litorea]THH39773.1 tetratricopeptide repeat protein [Neolewinella litorea]
MDVQGAVARIEQLLRLEKYDAARRIIDAGLRREPEERWLHLCLAEWEFLAGNRDEASRQADTVVGQHPDWCRAHYLNARIRVTEGDFPAAGEAIRAALALSPQVPEYLARMAHIQMVLHEPDKAIASASAALAIGPANVLALNVRSRSLLAQGRMEEAAEAYRVALAIAPDDAYNHLNYARYQIVVDKYRLAQEHYRIALQLRPGLHQARAGLVEAVKLDHRSYRGYQKVLVWSAGSEAQSVMSSLAVVGGSMGGMAVLKTLPSPLSLYVLLFGFLILWAMLGFRYLVNPITNWFLFSNRAHRTLLGQREWRLTYVVTVCVALGLVGALAFLATASSTALAVMTYGGTLVIPAYAIFGDQRVTGPGWWFAVAQPPLAVAGILATHYWVAPEPLYALSFICLSCLAGVMTRQESL